MLQPSKLWILCCSFLRWDWCVFFPSPGLFSLTAVNEKSRNSTTKREHGYRRRQFVNLRRSSPQIPQDIDISKEAFWRGCARSLICSGVWCHCLISSLHVTSHGICVETACACACACVLYVSDTKCWCEMINRSQLLQRWAAVKSLTNQGLRRRWGKGERLIQGMKAEQTRSFEIGGGNIMGAIWWDLKRGVKLKIMDHESATHRTSVKQCHD